MLHSRTTAASLQKIYEEGYLTCSTAVYYEGQGNEEEAMRCWKSAVEQIRRQYSESTIPDYAALSETEKALSDSLRELEYQAQERIDLLETLKLSRREDGSIITQSNGRAGRTPDGMGFGQSTRTASSSAGEGWIGDGTIPAITYSELSRPLPALPPRPSPLQPRRDSYDRAASYERLATVKKSDSSSGSSSRGPDRSPTEAEAAEPSSGQTGARNVLRKRTSQSPGHEKQDKPHTLRSTLRSSAPGESHHHSRSSRFSSHSKSRPSANKAATLAWSALGLTPKTEASSSRTATAVEPPLPKSKSRVHSTSSYTSSPIPVYTGKKNEDSPSSSQTHLQWDSNSRRLVPQRSAPDPVTVAASRTSLETATAAASVTEAARNSGEFATPHRPSNLSLNAAASALHRSLQSPAESSRTRRSSSRQRPHALSNASTSSIERVNSMTNLDSPPPKPKLGGVPPRVPVGGNSNSVTSLGRLEIKRSSYSSGSVNAYGTPVPERTTATASPTVGRRRVRGKEKGNAYASNEVSHLLADVQLEQQQSSGDDSDKQDEEGRGRDRTHRTDRAEEDEAPTMTWKKRKQYILKHLPAGVDEEAAKHILNEIVVQGDVVHWSDIAGLEPAKKALREVVVYPFLRPDLFMGLREPATGMLLFGPPGTGKTMLARAVATESKSTFFSISASSLTSKYLGESEKLVRALFGLAKTLAPSIIFVDEIDSILSQRSGSGEHEATRRIKTEFLIQWSDLQRAAAGREDSNHDSSSSGNNGSDRDSRSGDANRVLVLAATNLPWAIDEAARRRFARRQYIPLPEAETRAVQLRTLLGQQKHSLTEDNIQSLVMLTDGFSGSDITALAKDAAMGPLRSLGEALLMTKMDEIRPMELSDFVSSLETIRPSVSKTGLREYEEWAREFGERGG